MKCGSYFLLKTFGKRHSSYAIKIMRCNLAQNVPLKNANSFFNNNGISAYVDQVVVLRIYYIISVKIAHGHMKTNLNFYSHVNSHKLWYECMLRDMVRIKRPVAADTIPLPFYFNSILRFWMALEDLYFN